MAVGVDRLSADSAREALRLLGDSDPPAGVQAARRELRERLRGQGIVPAVLSSAPAGAREAFVRLAQDGPATVEALLERGWWGHGALPPPLDWLQVRAMVAVDADDGLVHATAEAVEGWGHLTLDLGGTAPIEPVEGSPQGSAAPTVRVEAARSVVIAPGAGQLARALSVSAAGLREVAPTVALSERPPRAVAEALRAGGLNLDDDVAVTAVSDAPALPGAVEEGAGPRAVRALMQRSVEERRQLWLRYFASSRGGAATERTIDAWSFADDILRGWCHLRDGERAFAVDRVGLARLLTTPPVHQAPGTEPGTAAERNTP